MKKLLFKKKLIYTSVLLLFLASAQKPSFPRENGNLKQSNAKYETIEIANDTNEIYSFNKKFVMLKGKVKESGIEKKLLFDIESNSIKELEEIDFRELFPKGAKKLILKLGGNEKTITPYIYENSPYEVIDGVIKYNEIKFDGNLYLEDIYTNEVEKIDLDLHEINDFKISNLRWSPDGKYLWIMVNDKYQFFVFTETMIYKRLYELEKQQLGIGYIKQSVNKNEILFKTNKISGKGVLSKSGMPYILKNDELKPLSLEGFNEDFSKAIADAGISDYGKYIYIISEKKDSNLGIYGINLYSTKAEKWKVSYIPQIGLDDSVVHNIDINSIKWGKNDYSFLVATERNNAFGYKFFYRKIISQLGISVRRMSFYDKYKYRNKNINKVFWGGNSMYEISNEGKIYKVY